MATPVSALSTGVTLLCGGLAIVPPTQNINTTTTPPSSPPKQIPPSNKSNETTSSGITNNSLEVLQCLSEDRDWPVLARGLTPPSAPLDINLTVVGNCVTLTWQKPKNMGGHEKVAYLLQGKDVMDSGEEKPWRTVYEGIKVELHIKNPPKNFCFRVAAKNGSGTGDFAPPICGTTENRRLISVEVSTSSSRLSSPVLDKEDEGEDEDEHEDLSAEEYDDLLAGL